MNKLKVLIEGYARENTDGTMTAASSTILLESNNKKVLVDPGANPDLLKAALEKEELTEENIDIITQITF